MKKIFKISSVIILFILAITLMSNFIFWRYPLNYLSYKTGYKIETINSLLEARHDRLTLSPNEYKQLCKNFNSEDITRAYNGLSGTSLFLIGFSFIAIIFFIIALKFNKTNSFKPSKKYTIALFFMLFASFLMFGSADLREWDLDFLTMCRDSITSGNLF